MLAREGALMPHMRAPLSLSSRSMARSRSFESITSRRNASSRAHRFSARLGRENTRHPLAHRVRTGARGIDTDRAAVGGDQAGVEHFEPVHRKQMREARERVVAQMLVIDGVVLQPLYEPDQVM